jgi:hypothetical protein
MRQFSYTENGGGNYQFLLADTRFLTGPHLFLGPVLSFFDPLLLLWSSYVAGRCIIQGAKLGITDGRLVLLNETINPILYLRSFTDDESYRSNSILERLATLSPLFSLFSVAMRKTYEEKLTKTLSRLAPVVAIGRPDDYFPPLGASRIYVPDNMWKAVVLELMERCQLVVLRIASSSGLRWELATAFEKLPADKIILYLERPFDKSPQKVQCMMPVQFDSPLPRKRFVSFNRECALIAANSLSQLLKVKGKRLPSKKLTVTIIVVVILLALLLILRAVKF